jgi:hypothetical protein
VAKAACPVNATTVEMWLGGKGVEIGTADCEQPAKSVKMNTAISFLGFMLGGNQHPAELFSGVQNLLILPKSGDFGLQKVILRDAIFL